MELQPQLLLKEHSLLVRVYKKPLNKVDVRMQRVIIWGYFYLKMYCATFERELFLLLHSFFVTEKSSNSKQYSNSKLLFNCWQTALSALSLITLPFFVKLEFSEAFYVPLSK